MVSILRRVVIEDRGSDDEVFTKQPLTRPGQVSYIGVIDGLGCLRATLAGIDVISDFGLGVYAWQGLPGVLSSSGFGFVLSFAVLG